MKGFFFAVFCSLVGSAFAAAPDSVAGFVFTEFATSVVRAETAQGLLLRPDGTYSGLYQVATFGIQRLGPRADGTWSYRKTGTSTAELALDGSTPQALTFTDDSRGTLTSIGTSVFIGSFTLTNPSLRPAMVNCSNRSFIAAGRTTITGFVLSDPFNAVLIRAVGPGLAAYGVTQFLPRPTFRVYRGEQEQRWDAANGAEALRRAAEYVGAFPLPADAGDAATLMILPAGAYTVHASSLQAADSGDVLVEAYLVR